MTRTISTADIAALQAVRGVIADAFEHPGRQAAIEAIDRLGQPGSGCADCDRRKQADDRFVKQLFGAEPDMSWVQRAKDFQQAVEKQCADSGLPPESEPTDAIKSQSPQRLTEYRTAPKPQLYAVKWTKPDGRSGLGAERAPYTYLRRSFGDGPEQGRKEGVTYEIVPAPDGDKEWRFERDSVPVAWLDEASVLIRSGMMFALHGKCDSDCWKCGAERFLESL